jgi:hypothetical protein
MDATQKEQTRALARAELAKAQETLAAVKGQKTFKITTADGVEVSYVPDELQKYLGHALTVAAKSRIVDVTECLEVTLADKPVAIAA